ncbi:anti-sigma factor family protein [Dictyobacter arantiisoli]|uniref:Zinc-finger domain-containing protein n=1 Tax=Dictyobacter arantiisoli TaxID=2014874 RepID=A0A5A5T8K2_9CHLR|nr:zf-HC2 domain-containing protein [Dictyobacter arantiisoli]GCF07595.1 hypothetical protein KDI_11590 [Dictyobacter arantiisoli]
MNCRQARALLAIYREHQQDPTDTPELKEHLAHCADCKDAYAQYQFIGERIRSLPSLELSAQAHSKLMQALAAEHVRFLQRTPASAPSTPTPAFLAPYLKDIAKQKTHADSLAAFSTADTGPLPIVRATRARRRSQPMPHIAIIGLAASFMVVVMLGGLVSLLFLTNQGQAGGPIAGNQVSISHVEAAQADTAATSTQTFYPHIASASTSNNMVYYSAYNENLNAWMLEKFAVTNDPNTAQESVPLLSTPSTRPLIVLGSNNNWLFWLQWETPKKTTSHHQNQPIPANSFEGAWTLKALYLAQDTSTSTSKNQSANQAGTATPLTLANNTFHAATAPSWLTSPIQGLAFYGNHALVALVDSTGVSHLINYQFDQNKLLKATELAKASAQHVLTSPTATSDGSSIYWSEEWETPDHGLNSNIWTEQAVNAQPAQSGRWLPHTQENIYVYRNDNLSFSPKVVNDTLFLLSKNPSNSVETNNVLTATATAANATATSTPQSATTSKASPTPTTPQNLASILADTSNVDPTIQVPQIDELVSGKLLTFTANGAAPETTTLNDNEIVSHLQSGGDFLLWQSNTQNFKMYDARIKVMVNGIDNLDRSSTAFMSINGNTILWTKYIVPTGNQSVSTDIEVTFETLKWPK